MSEIDYKRRKLLVAGGLTVGALLLPGMAFASPYKAANPRKISLCNIHTREDLETQYFDGQDYIKEELQRINYICRDFRRNEVAKMDRRLFDAITQIQEGLGHKGQVRIISGYRSPATNEALKKTGGVANKSHHMKGEAIDFNLEGVPLSKVRNAALELRLGGVGYYPKSGFVHIDTGRVRRW
ncbi:YcbK family protein [Photobacterium sp. SDRW27]|uniref:YcbK family protein n=1 Tax=Photobacterium obscurum TaxID=2829490 RepID=UPI0022448B89|nr:YcbK family protein [Photobacterium obscurum]MCW8327255.1 YcbK family protein [Photobacterium obscurum]